VPALTPCSGPLGHGCAAGQIKNRRTNPRALHSLDDWKDEISFKITEAGGVLSQREKLELYEYLVINIEELKET
jgi:hypothetical protein